MDHPLAASADGLDLFTAPVPPASASASLPPSIPVRSDHPLAARGVSAATRRAAGPLQTNKFYANLVLGDQDCPAYLLPYAVSWTHGRGPTNGWGLTVSYAPAAQRVFGPPSATCPHAGGPAAYFFSPPVVQHLVLDAAELGPSTALAVENPTDMSVLVSLRPGTDAAQPPAVQFPLVQGQGFVTALYNGARPVLRSAKAILSVDGGDGGHGAAGTEVKAGVRRFVLQMNDGAAWLLYARHLPGTAPLSLRANAHNATVVESAGAFYGSVQVARLLAPHWMSSAYDRAAGVYATGVSLRGHTEARGRVGTYRFGFAKADVTGRDAASPLLMFALPHHCASFDERTQAAVLRGLEMDTPTKGVARAVLADAWTMVEPDLPVDLGFLPWDPATRQTVHALPPAARQTIVDVARQELAEDMEAQSDLDSMYFSGKALAKFATMVLCSHELLHDAAAAATGLQKLTRAFARFAENRQRHPLVYESAWGGVVSSAAYTTGDAMADFGNTYYNDHHFHYGYFVYAGAVLAHLDPSWRGDGGNGGNGGNGAFVDLLVRDYANPTRRDGLFPVFRSFDWYHGHSWAHGLFASMDGKDQESSSEDAMAVYALLLWGLATGDARLAARGRLMLAVLARALQAYYYYYDDGGAVQPGAFVGNRVAGILFENKIDHTTYFGAAPAFIHGIHMLPLLPCTPLCRPPAFVAAEWRETFAGGGGSRTGRADQAEGGWRGVLYGNLATADPAAAWAFFSQARFDRGWLDGGASRTWYLCYAAALGGS
ncbi:beta-glucanase [Niveomyces insectorum RCEF 264]|uniref:glucan endo-1,3-beta-D-glucosidase n=1 Tax=Niveomyces insectorum RCEF 264 TaxID=1081102 RepID=A0A167WUK6_9HYPO|nr:beta-glucanase [Niveomyces insectorum RCEF 264]